MRKLSMLASGFRRNEKGALAIEFALVFPLMITIYMFMSDIHLAINDNRRVTDIANSTAQVAASFPSYDTTARAAINRSVNAHQLFLTGRELNLEILSVEFRNGQFRQVFYDRIRPQDAAEDGAAAAAEMMANIRQINYEEGDNIILVRAAIQSNAYVSGFFNEGRWVNFIENGRWLIDIAQTQSYNSRSYRYEEGASSRDFYNWQ